MTKQYPILKNVKNSIRIVEVIGLILIAIATTIAGVMEIMVMVTNMKVTLGDLLLLFLYLEVLAMVAIYLESGKLPIRFPLYIAIIALARYLILDMKALDAWQMLSVAVTMLIIGVTIMIIRYGHLKLPYEERESLEESQADDNNKQIAKK